jgi:hypothetical protein
MVAVGIVVGTFKGLRQLGYDNKISSIIPLDAEVDCCLASRFPG